MLSVSVKYLYGQWSMCNDSLPIKFVYILSSRGAERRPCPKCQASRKYYCYTCYITVGLDRSLIPIVHLPIKVDMWDYSFSLWGE